MYAPISIITPKRKYQGHQAIWIDFAELNQIVGMICLKTLRVYLEPTLIFC